MNARVRATSWIGGERVRATVLMLVERDGRLRFEAEVSLQGTVAMLATDGATFALLDARKNELSRGPGLPRQRRLADPHPARARRGGGDPAGRRAAARRRPPTAAARRVGAAPRRRRAGGARSRGRRAAALLPRRRRPRASSWRRRASAPTARRSGAPRTRTSRPSRGQRLPRTIRFAEGAGSFDDGVEIKIQGSHARRRRRRRQRSRSRRRPASRCETSAAASDPDF